MQIGHRGQTLKLTFRTLALRQSVWQKATARNVSFLNSLRWPIYIISSVKPNCLILKQNRSSKEISIVFAITFFNEEVGGNLAKP